MNKTINLFYMLSHLIMFSLVSTSIFGQISIQGEEMDLGSPKIETTETPKSIRVEIDGQVALTRELRNDGRSHQVIFAHNKIIGVTKSLEGAIGFDHSVNLVRNDSTIQVVTSDQVNYMIIRSAKSQEVVRVLVLDKQQPHVSVIK
jgi:hypothetical protein